MSPSMRSRLQSVRTRAEQLVSQIAAYAEPVADRGQRLAHHPLVRFAIFILRLCVWLVLIWAPFHYLRTLYDEAWAYLASKYWAYVWANVFPTHRTWFILSMFVLPKWSKHMAIAMVVFAFGRWLLGFVVSRITIRNIYLPLSTSENGYANGFANGHSRNDTDTELEPMLAHHEEATLRGSGSPPLIDRKAPPPSPQRWRIWNIFTLWNLFYWSIFLVHIGIVLFGNYLWDTQESEDHLRWRPTLEKAVNQPRKEGYGKGDKVMIGAMFYNNHAILPRWIEQMNKVIQYIGIDNVYVSVFESWSTDDTPTILEAWQKQLAEKGVPNRIITRQKKPVRPLNMKTEPPRLKFLADSRNIVFEPLTETGGGWDYIIYSNDIVVDAEDVVELLNTKNGDYDMACAFDYGWWGVTDGWVMRDRLGGMLSGTWPHIMERHGAEAMGRNEPAEVFSCWNGIVSMRADMFVEPELRNRTKIRSRLSRNKLPYSMPETHPMKHLQNVPPYQMPALKFRTSVGEECFSSECFLLPYDMQRQFNLRGIYMNPRVVSTYNFDHHIWYSQVLRHWLVRWYIQTIEYGRGIQMGVWMDGRPPDAYLWDGGACTVFLVNKRPLHNYKSTTKGGAGRSLVPEVGSGYTARQIGERDSLEL